MLRPLWTVVHFGALGFGTSVPVPWLEWTLEYRDRCMHKSTGPLTCTLTHFSNHKIHHTYMQHRLCIWLGFTTPLHSLPPYQVWEITAKHTRTTLIRHRYIHFTTHLAHPCPPFTNRCTTMPLLPQTVTVCMLWQWGIERQAQMVTVCFLFFFPFSVTLAFAHMHAHTKYTHTCTQHMRWGTQLSLSLFTGHLKDKETASN